MKRLLSFIFLLSVVLMAYGQNTDSQRYFQEGNTCFERGDYDCAKKNYEASRATGGSVPEQLQKTEECIKILFAANLMFEEGNYGRAWELYGLILKINPLDQFVRIRMESFERDAISIPQIQQNQPLVSLQTQQSQPPASSFENYTETKRNLNIEMIAVQGGTFSMGCTLDNVDNCSASETPAHRVTVSDFYIGKYEVTQAQWKLVMGDNPSRYKGDNLPVEKVSWRKVKKFIIRLNTITGMQYRLPTEAEWEFAARGGNNSRSYEYSGSNNVGNVAWYRENSEGKTHAVGTKASNELGIYDMSGNVLEWCSDHYGRYSSNEQIDPKGPKSSNPSQRVIRGGSWSSNARSARVSFRFGTRPGGRYTHVGFRLARSSN